ncbi:glycosyltransferase family 9 protein [Roseiarcus sp.]|uniref:glycosyltransferase family 9 protein n=1 Tax=Roseiarcus sp. TaxID=1969460 RepID=UPI003F98678D
MNQRESQRISATPHFRMKDGVARPDAVELGPRGLSDLVAKLLDESDAGEFRSAERILDALERQGRTIAGYPRVRPIDCAHFVDAIKLVFDSYRRAFVTAEPRIVRRFEEILEAFEKTDVRSYPSELMRARMLHAEARLLLNDPGGARALIQPYADRIYKIEGGRDDILRIMRLDCEAQAALGAVDDIGRVAVARARTAARLWPPAVRAIASTFINFMGFDRSAQLGHGVFAWLLIRVSRVAARARVPGGSFLRRIWRSVVSSVAVSAAGLCLYLMRWGDLRWTESQTRNRDVVVTRAMGGIGDLLIMTAGLRALSKLRVTRVKLIVERKFFDLFRNNPYVELIDIDGPPVDVVDSKAWYNLTLCPAARYESRRRPFVRKGRAELFAASMGVGRRLLDAYGWHVEYVLDEGQNRFRDDFLRDNGLGSRPIVGVQPYARDSYKDHQEIERFVSALAERYDLIVFHHVETSLASSPGIASTAGLALAESIALVSALDAMVCVDSAFLHAAAAFDVPVIALFGPTDGELFTRHHRQATVINANESFACAPCWRNEDLPCSLTGKFGPSPCIAAIRVEPVLAAVEQALGRSA